MLDDCFTKVFFISMLPYKNFTSEVLAILFGVFCFFDGFLNYFKFDTTEMIVLFDTKNWGIFSGEKT